VFIRVALHKYSKIPALNCRSFCFPYAALRLGGNFFSRQVAELHKKAILFISFEFLCKAHQRTISPDGTFMKTVILSVGVV
jgi:hypothetical protein